MSENINIYTVGHSDIGVDEFVALLRRFGIETVIDVRSAPYSRHAPQFNHDAIAAALEREGFRYLFLGHRLGGRPDNSACYVDGKVDYGLVRRTHAFQQGIEDAIEAAARSRAALMCSEEDPARCHRSMLVAPALIDAGVDVIHIRRDGATETEDDLLRRKPASDRQMGLDL